MSGPGGGADLPPGFGQLLGAAESETFDVADKVKNVCEQNKNQLKTLKEIMLHNKQTLKQKEEEVQEYATKLSKIKSRTHLSRRSRDASSSVEGTSAGALQFRASNPAAENFDDVVDDISQAKTPKAKSSLLKKKLAENRKIFEQRSKEMTENKRAVEEKVEAIRQQLDESDSTISGLQSTILPLQAVVTTTKGTGSVLQNFNLQDKDDRIAELSNKVLQLEATVLDLQENLKEKDSVIDAKTKAITLMTSDLTLKSKYTLDTLEDTKDEMRMMQANFVLIERSLKDKIHSLLQQLQGRDGQIAEYENTVEGLKEDLEKQKITDTATADFSRSTLDTLAETKDAMKSMQENFVLIETSLKSKVTNLLDQLQEREVKLADAEEKIFRLESGDGIVTPVAVMDLQIKLEIVEQHNRLLQDENYELQKSFADLQGKAISDEPTLSNGLILEKDNRIAELENLIEELRKSNQLLLEESKTELHNQIIELTSRNEEYVNKVNHLEKLVHYLETEKNELAKRISEESDESKNDAKLAKLSKELDELNKSTIKLKAQHKIKVKSLQKQLESFKKVSDANAELVKLGNQVTLLEEEKGNLQLSLVDFDELKASAGDLQEHIADLDTKICTQGNEIDSQVQAIATLENQKLDLMQELHNVKQEVSALEAENAESENLRVTAEMKIVELEEQLDALHKSIIEPKPSDLAIESEKNQYLDRIEFMSQENNTLIVKLAKFREKGTLDAGPTESFETLHEADRNELLRKIDILVQENRAKLEERIGPADFYHGSDDTTKDELLNKIDLLVQEKNNLVVKLAKFEEKSSSDTGSTESFERIPEHVENLTRVDILTQENNELVIKLIKLEEKLAQIADNPNHGLKYNIPADNDIFKLKNEIYILTQENNDLVIQLTKLQEKLAQQFTDNVTHQDDLTDSVVPEIARALAEEKNALALQIAKLEAKNEDLMINFDIVTRERDELKATVVQMTTDTFASALVEKLNELGNRNQSSIQVLREEITKLVHKLPQDTIAVDDSTGYKVAVTVTLLENEILDCKKMISEKEQLIKDMKLKLSDKEVELKIQTEEISKYEASRESVEQLQIELNDSVAVIEDLKQKFHEMEEKIKFLEFEKESIEESLRIREGENVDLINQSEEKDQQMVKLQTEMGDIISELELKLNNEIQLALARGNEISVLEDMIVKKDADFDDKYEKLHNKMITIDILQEDLNDYKLKFESQRSSADLLRAEIEKQNATLTNKTDEIISARTELQELRSNLENSRSLQEFNELVKALNDNQEVMNQMQKKLNEQADENVDLHMQIKSITSNIHKMEEQLVNKQEELAQLTEINRCLNDELNQSRTTELRVTTQISHLQSTLEHNAVYVDDLRNELSGVYKKLELVKLQHTEDTEMQNRRLENLIEELNYKMQENDNLKSEIEEKQKILEQNLIEGTLQVTLQLRVKELEQQSMESEVKGKAQIEKMKKIAANLKKKAVQCQVLEAKVADLEEKWNSEKCEKEAINKRIHEHESIVREKDNKILSLERKLIKNEEEASIALGNVSRLMQEIDISKEKVNSLLEQVTEMGEEVETLQAEINTKATELERERAMTQNVLSEYQVYKLEMDANYEKQQNDLEEATECARELRVRMEVMENEYVEQLSLIQKLKAENGMLSSRETQINEKLENVEKESEERKYLLEKLQTEKSAGSHKAQTLDCELGESVSKSPEEQCRFGSAGSIQALVAKLQERDAVVESLEIELGKSNGRVNKLEEALVAMEDRRHSLERRTELLGAELEKSFRITEEASFSEDMLEQRLATLMAKDTAVNEKLNETMDENNELTVKIQSLQDLNISLQERIDAIEEELKYGKETNDKLQNIDILYSELLEKHNLQESELKKTQQKLISARQHIDSSEMEVTSQINHLDFEKKQLLEKCEKLEDERMNLVQEIESLKDVVNMGQQRVSELESEVDTRKEVNNQLVLQLNNQQDSAPILKEQPENLEKKKLMSLLAEKDVEIENYQRRNMQLHMAAFDAPTSSDVSNVFNTTTVSDTTLPAAQEIYKLTKLLSAMEHQYADVCTQLDHSKQQLDKCKSDFEGLLHEKEQYCSQILTTSQNLNMQYDQCQNELLRMNEVVLEKSHLVESLNAQLSDISIQLQLHSNCQDRYDEEISRFLGIIRSKDEEFQVLRNDLNLTNEALERVTLSETENHALIEDKNILIDQLENVKSTYETELPVLKFQQQETERIINQIISDTEQKLAKMYERQVETNTTEISGLHRIASILNELLREFGTVKLEKDELFRSQISYVREIQELQSKLDSVNNNEEQVLELKNELVKISQEKNILQDSLQMRELILQEVKKDFNEVVTEKQSLEKHVSDLMVTVSEFRNMQYQRTSDNHPEKSTLETNPTAEIGKKGSQLALSCEWDSGSTDKLDTEGEGWGWDVEEVQPEEEHQLSVAPFTPSVEIQLHTRVSELEDQINDLEVEKATLDKERKALRLKTVKLVKKLKEFKIQNDLLEQKVKQQQCSYFPDLDSAIEEELKSQIANLEKSLKDAVLEQKKAATEKEHLQNRLEVLMAANERFVEVKERQDMDLQVWNIRNAELTNKIQALEWQLQEISANTNQEALTFPLETKSQDGLPESKTDRSGNQTDRSDVGACQSCQQYADQIDGLKEEMEALASENEQLQNLLEVQKIQNVVSNTEEGEKLIQQNNNLQSSLSKLQDEYNLLRKQYEQSLMDANDQVTAMRQNSDLLRAEFDAKFAEFDNDKKLHNKELDEWNLKVNDLQQRLQFIQEENSNLLEKAQVLESTEEKLSSVSISLTEVTELLNMRVQEISDLKQNYQRQYLEKTEAESNSRSKIDELSQELSSKQQEILNLKQLLSDKENDITRQESLEVHSLRVELVGKKQEIEQLGDALAGKETNDQKCIEQLQEDMSPIVMLQKEINELRTTLLAKQANLEKVSDELTIRTQELAEKESYLQWYTTELSRYSAEIEKNQNEIREMKNLTVSQGVTKAHACSVNQSVDIHEKDREIGALRLALQEKESLNERHNQEIQKRSNELRLISFKVSELEEQVAYKNRELEKCNWVSSDDVNSSGDINSELNKDIKETNSCSFAIMDLQKQETVELPNSFPQFILSDNNDDCQLPTDVNSLRSELKQKEEEIEHLNFILNENTYPELIQRLQDDINQLHSDKYQTKQILEAQIKLLSDELVSKQTELDSLRQQIQVKSNEHVPSESYLAIAAERPLLPDQEAIARLQNELHTKEQEINELRYVISQKDSQISLQASTSKRFDEFEIEQTLQRLNGDLCVKQQEITNLRVTLEKKEMEIEDFREMKHVSEEEKNLISNLLSEKELWKKETESVMQSRLVEKEAEIDMLKCRLAAENEELLDILQVKDADINNSRIQMEQLNSNYDKELHNKNEELLLVKVDLAEQVRRLAEISVKKDTEIHNLEIQIRDRDIRIEELIALTKEEERQLNELRRVVESKEGEINNLKTILTKTVQEYETIQKALKIDAMAESSSSTVVETDVKQIATVTSGSDEPHNSIARAGVVTVEGELDIALYMLHQRDVRCEELTLELMQLLEERDTLQLRLSNAIRVNEELRKQTSTTSSLQQDFPSRSFDNPLVEHLSPAKSKNSVEIAKEALFVETFPIGEDRYDLARNSRCPEPVKHPDKLAVGEKHTKGNAHVMNAMET